MTFWNESCLKSTLVVWQIMASRWRADTRGTWNRINNHEHHAANRSMQFEFFPHHLWQQQTHDKRRRLASNCNFRHHFYVQLSLVYEAAKYEEELYRKTSAKQVSIQGENSPHSRRSEIVQFSQTISSIYHRHSQWSFLSHQSSSSETYTSRHSKTAVFTASAKEFQTSESRTGSKTKSRQRCHCSAQPMAEKELVRLIVQLWFRMHTDRVHKIRCFGASNVCHRGHVRGSHI